MRLSLLALVVAVALPACTPTSTTIGGKVAQASVLYTPGARTKDFIVPPGYYYPSHTVTGPFFGDRDGYHTETVFLSPMGIQRHVILPRGIETVRGGVTLKHDPKQPHPRIWYKPGADYWTAELPSSFQYKLLPLQSAPYPNAGQSLRAQVEGEAASRAVRDTTATMLRNQATITPR